MYSPYELVGGPDTLTSCGKHGRYTSLQKTANEIEVLSGQEYVDYINEASQFVPGPDGYGMIDI